MVLKAISDQSSILFFYRLLIIIQTITIIIKLLISILIKTEEERANKVDVHTLNTHSNSLSVSS